MGLVDKFKDFMGMDSDEEGYEEDFEGTGEVDFLSGTPSAKKQEETTVVGYDEVASKRNKVVNINTTAQLQVVLVKPEKFEDASAVADHLNAKRTVVLNLQGNNKDISRRLVDFLSGVASANTAQIQRVANSTLIITPYNVELVGDLMDELENNGTFS